MASVEVGCEEHIPLGGGLTLCLDFILTVTSEGVEWQPQPEWNLFCVSKEGSRQYPRHEIKDTWIARAIDAHLAENPKNPFGVISRAAAQSQKGPVTLYRRLERAWAAGFCAANNPKVFPPERCARDIVEIAAWTPGKKEA